MEVNLEALVECLKAEINHRAKAANIPFDADDIKFEKLPGDGYHLVLLTLIKNGEGKTANLWFDPPPEQLCRFEETSSPNVLLVKFWAPRVHMLCDWLIYIIRPDGSYAFGREAFEEWFYMEWRNMCEEDLAYASNSIEEKLDGKSGS